MKKLLIAHKNIKASFYTQITIVSTASVSEFRESLERELINMSPEAYSKLKDIETYALGIFDDKNGKIDLFEEKEFVISTNDYEK